MNPENETPPEGDRRAFLKNCGRFAVITPPAVTFLLSTSMSSKAIAVTSGRGGDGGSLGFLAAGAGAGAAVVGVGALSPGQAAPGPLAAPVQAPAAPLAAAPPPPPAAAAPPPSWSAAGERG